MRRTAGLWRSGSAWRGKRQAKIIRSTSLQKGPIAGPRHFLAIMVGLLNILLLVSHSQGKTHMVYMVTLWYLRGAAILAGFTAFDELAEILSEEPQG